MDLFLQDLLHRPEQLESEDTETKISADVLGYFALERSSLDNDEKMHWQATLWSSSLSRSSCVTCFPMARERGKRCEDRRTLQCGIRQDLVRDLFSRTAGTKMRTTPTIISVPKTITSLWNSRMRTNQSIAPRTRKRQKLLTCSTFLTCPWMRWKTSTWLSLHRSIWKWPKPSR